jgi:hypothetical protein
MDTVQAYVDWRACTATPLSRVSWPYQNHTCSGCTEAPAVTSDRCPEGWRAVPCPQWARVTRAEWRPGSHPGPQPLVQTLHNRLKLDQPGLRIRDVHLGSECFPTRIPDLHQSILTSVADPGCLSRIPDPNCLHPGSRIRIKEFKYSNQKKLFLNSRKYDPGCSSQIRIRDLDPDVFSIPDPGSRGQKAPDPGSRIWIRNTAINEPKNKLINVTL